MNLRRRKNTPDPQMHEHLTRALAVGLAVPAAYQGAIEAYVAGNPTGNLHIDPNDDALMDAWRFGICWGLAAACWMAQYEHETGQSCPPETIHPNAMAVVGRSVQVEQGRLAADR